MNITKIISSTIQKALLVLKHSPFNKVIRTNELLSPFGLDANPFPGIKGAVLSATSKGRGAIIGFFNKFVSAAPGEIRIYSTDPAGNGIVTEIHFKNDGTMTIKAAIPGGGPLFDMTVDAAGNVTVASPLVSLTGDLTIIGNLTVTGNGIITGTLSIGGKDFTAHTHPYTDDGNPLNTGPPN